MGAALLLKRVLGITAGDLEPGAIVYIQESDGTFSYHVCDTDYLGKILLVRDTSPGLTRYKSSPSSQAMSHKYNNSNLDSNINSFYDNLPVSTKAIIQAVDIPVRSHAGNGSSQEYLTRYAFALSAKEWGLGGSDFEGEPIEYTGTRDNDTQHWTREPIGGMPNYAYCVNVNGERASVEVKTLHNYRPAMCISPDQEMEETDGGYVPVI